MTFFYFQAEISLTSKTLTLSNEYWAIQKDFFQRFLDERRVRLWLSLNFIPMNSRKMEFWNFNYRFTIKNVSEIEKIEGSLPTDFEKNYLKT